MMFSIRCGFLCCIQTRLNDQQLAPSNTNIRPQGLKILTLPLPSPFLIWSKKGPTSTLPVFFSIVLYFYTPRTMYNVLKGYWSTMQRSWGGEGLGGSGRMYLEEVISSLFSKKGKSKKLLIVRQMCINIVFQSG